MNEKSKTWIILGFVGLIILLIVLLAINSGQKSQRQYENFEKAFNGEKNTLVYIGRPTCSYCTMLEPSLKEMSERYKFEYIYINIDDMSTNYFNQVMEKLGLTEIGTPYLAVVKGGKVVDKQNGYVDYDKLFEFNQKNEIISKDAKLELNYIGLSEYEKLLASKEKNVIVVGQSTCTYCIQAKLVLNKIADEKDVVINYLNVSYLTEEEGKKLEASLDFFSKEWGTPVMLVVQDGKLVKELEGYNSESSYISFLKEQGVLK